MPKNPSVKFMVGQFSISDNKAALSINGFVEVTSTYTESLFFLALNAHHGTSISIKLNSIEMRALSNALEHISHEPRGKSTHTKESGGSGSTSTLTLSSNEKYHYLTLNKGNNKIEISFKPFELLSLSQEISHLVNEVASSTYKTQQHMQRKKNKKKKEEN